MFVYKIENLVNSKTYIGQSTQKTEHRLQEHKSTLRSNTHKNPHLQKAWNKYGEKSFLIKIIDHCKSIKQLNKLEQKYIDLYDCLNRERGYNIRGGGDNAFLSEETKKLISETKRGVSVHTPESKRKIAESSRNRIHSDESKRKRSEKLKGYIWSDEVKMQRAIRQRPDGYPVIVSPDGTEYEGIVNLSKFCREHNLSAIQLAKVVNGHGLTHKGWYVKGSRISELQRATDNSKRLRPQGYPVVLDENGNTYSIESLSAFCRENKLSLSCMSNLVNKKRQSYKGWTILEKR